MNDNRHQPRDPASVASHPPPAFGILVLLATGLMFVVIVLSAYIRLRHNGLGCAPWPDCYGDIVAPASTPAWATITHRLVASALGVVILTLALIALLRRCRGRRSRPTIEPRPA